METKEKSLEALKKAFVPGHTYRRAELASYSTNLDLYLKKLVQSGEIKKVGFGLYSLPEKSAFGEALPDESVLIEAFLKDTHFVVYSPSQFNSLELGTTQLYNLRVVFNRKRAGKFKLGGRVYKFQYWREAPKSLTKEFLLVQMLNELKRLPEDQNKILENLKLKLSEFDLPKLKYALEHYGKVSAKKIFSHVMRDSEAA